MTAIELLGMLALHAAVPGQSWFRCYFYSVMAFCNAGFSLDPGSIAVFKGYPLALLTMGVLLTLGGLGFLVLYNLCTIQFWRRNLVARGRLSFHSRMVLLTSLLLTVLALVFVFVFEWNGALEPYSSQISETDTTQLPLVLKMDLEVTGNLTIASDGIVSARNGGLPVLSSHDSLYPHTYLRWARPDRQNLS